MDSGISGFNVSDYAMIKNGSYGKLMKAYYTKQDADSLSRTGDSKKSLTLMRSSADSLKKSAETLNNASLWEKKKLKKKNEETGEETEVWDYDWDTITKAVKTFVDDYNSVVKQAGNSDTRNVLRNASWMTEMTEKAGKLLLKVGITIGAGNKLEFDEETLKKTTTLGKSSVEMDNISTLKTLFTGYGSFADKVSQKAQGISRASANAAAKASALGSAYTKNGTYSDTLSKLFSSTIDEKVGDKDKNKSWWEKELEKKEQEKREAFKPITDTKKDEDNES